MSIYQSILSRLSILIVVGVLSIFLVYAQDGTPSFLPTQTVSSSGSNSNFVSVSTGSTIIPGDCTATGATCLVNQDNNSSIIGDYLRGYYYDSAFGFFKFDWDTTESNNVRFVASTDRCQSTVGGYGYKLGGYAYGGDAGFMNFSYSSDIFVYYCESDKKLHGYAYSTDNGFQSFEGIDLVIVNQSNIIQIPTITNDPNFVNNPTFLISDEPDEVGLFPLQGELPATDGGNESLFYIVK